MLKFLRSAAFMALLSGFLTAVAVCYINIVLIWVCFIPLFIFLNHLTAKKAFIAGLDFGGAIAIAGFYWMIPGAERFTGSSIIYGIIVFVISGCFFSLFFGLITWCFSLLKIDKNANYATPANAILIACIFCIGEALLTYVSSGFPWFDFHAGYALSANLYAVQPAGFFGVYILSFVVLLVNYLCTVFISKKQWTKLFIPAGIITIYFLSGYFILQNFENNLQPSKTVNIAILSENIAPEIKWNDNTGNALAERLMNMSRQATDLKPDIALWSESAIPWTYRKDDDLVNAILKITKPASITHILGINTEAGGSNMVYNSAYCITPNGNVTGRYDKQVLLSLIEKPLSGAIIPFMSSAGFTAKTGEYSAPLNTPFGKTGIIICNESAVPATAYNAIKGGAGFLCNMSNDGWFNNTYIVGLHFYNARLRAVETRKDMVVNSNNGYSGLIKASGAIAMQERSNQPLVKLVTVDENHIKTLASSCPWLFTYFCLGVLIIACAMKLRKVKKTVAKYQL
jgi:apolipoprotein N-acyltransferase